ncbi:hypothetical protein [Nannocystis pusilla]|uniref:hypothetical protein n=1 Tax=Nannocystis pusilla TaxID=889268 RepID=UPI003B809AEA
MAVRTTRTRAGSGLSKDITAIDEDVGGAVDRGERVELLVDEEVDGGGLLVGDDEPGRGAFDGRGHDAGHDITRPRGHERGRGVEHGPHGEIVATSALRRRGEEAGTSPVRGYV